MQIKFFSYSRIANFRKSDFGMSIIPRLTAVKPNLKTMGKT